MPKLDSGLESGLSVLDRRRLFSDRAIWTFVFVGLALVSGAMSGLWQYSGYLVDEGAVQRYIVVAVAAIFGLALGWMIFPRAVRSRDV